MLELTFSPNERLKDRDNNVVYFKEKWVVIEGVQYILATDHPDDKITHLGTKVYKLKVTDVRKIT